MKKLLIILSIASFFAACTNNSEKKSDSTDAQTIISSVDEFVKDANLFLDQEVTVEGLVTHVCKHGGQKLFIAGTEEGVSLRIEVGEGIPEFTIDMEGSNASFTGIVKLMDDEFITAAVAEHEDHHGDEEAVEEEHVEGDQNEHSGDKEAEEGEHDENYSPTEKTYYLIATGFKIL